MTPSETLEIKLLQRVISVSWGGKSVHDEAQLTETIAKNTKMVARGSHFVDIAKARVRS